MTLSNDVTYWLFIQNKWHKSTRKTYFKSIHQRKILLKGQSPNEPTDQDKSDEEWNNTSQISNNW